jgi:hypothetical protein
MFKEVPYFCYSHLLALITVAPTVTGPAPVFDELLLPPSPLLIDNVLSVADIAQARNLIALVGTTRYYVNLVKGCIRSRCGGFSVVVDSQ